MYCSKCGKEIDVHVVACPHCGEPTGVRAKQEPLPLPNVVGALVCSILGMVLPFVGLVLSIVGLSIAQSAKKVVRANPAAYGDTGLLTVAQVISIVGIVQQVLVLCWVVFCVVVALCASFDI